jgi:DNA-binding PadR family transcriptional regulator
MNTTSMSDEFLKDLLSDVDAIQAPPATPSPRQRRAFREALGILVLDESKIVTVILKILARGRKDGGEIIAKLNEIDVRFEVEGEGVIFALLSRMEDQELILGGFNDTMTQRTYGLDSKGEILLNRSEDSVRNLSEHLAMLWA